MTQEHKINNYFKIHSKYVYYSSGVFMGTCLRLLYRFHEFEQFVSVARMHKNRSR